MSRSLFDIIFLALLWGPSFVFMKIAVEDIPPITVATLRIGIAALCLLLVVRLWKISLPKSKKVWLHATVMGFFASACPFVLFAYAVLNIESIVGGLVTGIVPILTVILAHFFIEDEKITPMKLSGVIIGFVGFLLLFVPRLKGGIVPGEIGSIIACFLAACCYSIGMVYTRKFLVELHPIVLPTAQLTTSVIILLPIALLIDLPEHIQLPCWQSCCAILGLSILGTALAFVWYSRILRTSGSTALSMVTFLFPIIGAILGVVFLGEHLSVEMILAGVLIILGMVVVNSGKREKH